MDCSTPGLPVHNQLLEPTAYVSDAIQPSHCSPVPLPWLLVPWKPYNIPASGIYTYSLLSQESSSSRQWRPHPHFLQVSAQRSPSFWVFLSDKCIGKPVFWHHFQFSYHYCLFHPSIFHLYHANFACFIFCLPTLGLSDLANKNTRHPAKFEFQVKFKLKTKYFLVCVCPKYCIRHSRTKILSLVTT